MNKKFFIILFSLMVMFCGCSSKNIEKDTLSQIIENDVIKVGVKIDTPPFGYLDINNANIGFDVDLARFLAKKILGDENKVKFLPVSTSNRIMKLSSGEVDMIIATMSINTQRATLVDFSVPYHYAGQALMVKKDSKISTLQELAGKKVIIVFGSTAERSIRESIHNVVILGYKTYPEAVTALKTGKADAMIADDTILLGYAMNDSELKLIPKRYSKEPYAVALRKGVVSEKLLETIDIELKEALNNGQIEKMKNKWNIE